jgi:hypothetical protein
MVQTTENASSPQINPSSLPSIPGMNAAIPPSPVPPTMNGPTFMEMTSSSAAAECRSNYENVIHKMNWKLFKAKNVLIYHLCDECHQLLFNSQDKITPLGDDNHWIVKFELCHSCIVKNIHGTTSFSKPYVRRPPNNNQQQPPQQ